VEGQWPGNPLPRLKPGAFSKLRSLSLTSACANADLSAVLRACGAKLEELQVSHRLGGDSGVLPAFCQMARAAEWRQSLKKAELSHPRRCGLSEPLLARALADTLPRLSNLTHLTLPEGRDGAVVGLLLALEAGALRSLRRWVP
jgi:hypothetical protein